MPRLTPRPRGASSTTSASRSPPSTGPAARPPTSSCCASIFQMGIPVSGKNLFPSNIAGLPTWYTIRANKDGYVARKKEIDFLVAMNAETAREDVLVARRRRRGRLRRTAEAERTAAGPGVLSGALRQDRRRGLQGRQAAPPGEEHDLRRRAGAAARDRHRADGARAPPSDGQEAQGDRAQPGRARGRQALRRRAPAEAGSVRRSSR